MSSGDYWPNWNPVPLPLWPRSIIWPTYTVKWSWPFIPIAPTQPANPPFFPWIVPTPNSEEIRLRSLLLEIQRRANETDEVCSSMFRDWVVDLLKQESLGEDFQEAVETPITDRTCCSSCQPRYQGMMLCKICGNKRCPRAANHENKCTKSNEVGQAGSNYPIVKEGAD